MANDKIIENALHIYSQMDYQNILGPPRTKEDLQKEIDCSSALTMLFNSLQPPFLENFIAYCTGAKGLPLTYDSVFKFIFNPESHPERLSRFLSLIIGKEVTVKRALPNEGGRIIEEGSLLI